jgi:transcriptional regulator with XRE-family HTH domain
MDVVDKSRTAALALDGLLEQSGAPTQDGPTRTLREARDAQKRATRRAFKKLAQKRFSEKLCAAMTQTGLSASQLARKIWGEEKNSRGATAAKNRDRVGLYMKGLSYPQPATMKQLADAIGIPIEELVPPPRIARKPREPRARAGKAAEGFGFRTAATERQPLLNISMLPGKQHARLQMDQIVPLSLALDIARQIDTLKAGTVEHEPQLGSVV